jgi:hypothetical protein
METSEEYGKDRDDKGRFGKGNKASSNRGPNKVSSKVKESIVNFLESNVDQIQESFDQLKPREKLQFISDILPYAAPKLSSIQTEHSGELSHKIEITWNDPGDIELPDSEDKGSP